MKGEEIRQSSCCSLGHRKISISSELREKVREAVENLICIRGVRRFLFGSRSEFDSLCYRVVTNLKEKYSDIERVYVRAEFPVIDDSYERYLLSLYEGTYYPHHIIGAGRVVCVERNYHMINESAYCVFYYDRNYEVIRNISTNSGTRLAYDYAIRKNVEIYNVLGVAD